MQLLSIVAILLSPVIALMISSLAQNRKFKRAERMSIFTTLMATRHSPIMEENVRALNIIDVMFHDCRQVRQLWREYFEMLCNKGLDNEQGYATRQRKNLELIHEMGKALGYGKEITHLDVDRVYYPVGLGMQSEKAQQIADELLRVLKATQALSVTQRSRTASRRKEAAD